MKQSILGLLLALLLAVMASAAHAQKWANTATISPTAQFVSNSLCFSDGRDLACDSSAGLLVTSGTVAFSNISTTNISLSTINGQPYSASGGSGDRITSGTTSMVAQTASSIISITNGGTNTGYFNSNGVLTLPGISATANLTSVTSLFASGKQTIGTFGSGVDQGLGLNVGNTALTFAGPASSGTSETRALVRYQMGSVVQDYGVFQNGSTWVQNRLVTALGTNLPYLINPNGGAVGINTASPTTALEVNGTISATNFVGNGSGLTNITGASSDRIVSGTTSMIANSATGIISITNLGVAVGYINSNGVHVLPGISATSNLTSVTSLYASGLVGIGTSSPAQKLEVNGNILVDGNVAVSGSGAAIQVFDRTTAGSAFFYRTGGVNYLNDSVGGNIIAFTTSGTVGIGTASPTTKLEVSGNISASNVYATGLVVGTTSTLTGVMTAGAGTDHILDVRGDPASFGFISTTLGPILEGTNTAQNAFEPFTIAGSSINLMIGNVGIGTTSPTAKLDVNGTISATAIQVKPFSTTCSSGISGTLRYSTISSTMEYCNGSSWTTIGSTGVYGYEVDTNSQAAGAAVGWYYASCPAGKNALGGGCSTGSGGGLTNTQITSTTFGCYKQSTATNYVEYVACGYASTSSAASGGGTPGGSTGDVQFNSAGVLAADTGNFTYASGLLTAPTISTSAITVYGASGITTFTGTTKLGLVVRGSTGATDYSGMDFIGNGQTNPLARIGALSTNLGSYLQFGTSNNYASGITNAAMTIDPSGNMGIGTALPDTKLTVSLNTSTLPAPPANTVLRLAQVNGAYPRLLMDTFGVSTANVISLRFAEGTAAAPTATQGLDQLGQITAAGYGATGYSATGRVGLIMYADQNWTDTAQGAYMAFLTTPDNTTAPQETMHLSANGNVGIGTTAPSVPLEVSGTISASAIAENPAGGFISGYAFKFKNPNTYASSLCYLNSGGFDFIGACTSLNKWKRNQKPLSIGLKELMKLRPVEFDWTQDHGGFHDLGFIAEEVEKSVPLLAEYSDGKLISVKYRQMTSLLAKAIQELKGNTDAAEADLQKQIDKLKADNDNLRASQASDHAAIDSLHVEFETYKGAHP